MLSIILLGILELVLSEPKWFLFSSLLKISRNLCNCALCKCRMHINAKFPIARKGVQFGEEMYIYLKLTNFTRVFNSLLSRTRRTRASWAGLPAESHSSLSGSSPCSQRGSPPNPPVSNHSCWLQTWCTSPLHLFCKKENPILVYYTS